MALGLGKVALVANTAQHPPPERLPFVTNRLLAGDFDTQVQFDRADAALKVSPSVTGRWLDRQYASIRVVDAPVLGPNVFYLEWRSGGPSGPVSRQRLWALRPGTSSMAFYTFKDPAPFAGRAAKAGAFRRLSLDQLLSYPAACDVQWKEAPHYETLEGRIDPITCRIVAQSGRGMRLDVTIAATERGFTYQEKGILDDGRIAFAVPPTEPYRFERVR